MKVLLVGVGGVGEAIAAIAKERPWVEQIVLADYNLERAKEIQKKLGDPERFPAKYVDASNQKMIEELARERGVAFPMTVPAENELRAAGATDSLLRVLRAARPRSSPPRHTPAASGRPAEPPMSPRRGSAAAALIVAALLPVVRPPAPLVGDLVDKHIAYSQIERPAEVASADREEIEEWFRQRAGLRITVPDFSPSGIQLVGARLAETRERKAAYLLYEKGRTLLSVFMVPPASSDAALAGTRVAYRGYEYLTQERKGYRTVSWTEGQAVFGFVSMLDYDALLECADRLRAERAAQTRL